MNAAAVLDALRSRGWTLAAAESLTGGLFLATLTDVPGASDVVRGGVVVYATDLKHHLVGVDADLLDRVGPVHPDVALALADGVRRRCCADVGVGLTGVAGPTEQDGHPVGTVFVAVATPDATIVWPLPPPVAPTTRAEVRAAAVRAALDLLARVLGDGFADGEKITARAAQVGGVASSASG